MSFAKVRNIRFNEKNLSVNVIKRALFLVNQANYSRFKVPGLGIVRVCWLFYKFIRK